MNFNSLQESYSNFLVIPLRLLFMLLKLRQSCNITINIIFDFTFPIGLPYLAVVSLDYKSVIIDF